MRASDCNQLSNELVQQLYQHCLIFPHPPRKYVFAMWHFLLLLLLLLLILLQIKGRPPQLVNPS